jgi:glycosyltransferase involved in cell wall biosynthesis
VRILYHHRTLADGAEGIHIASMLDAFRSLGHEVRLVGAAPNGQSSERHLVSRVRARLPRAAFEAASVALNVPEYLHLQREFATFRPDLLYKRHARYDVAALLVAHRRGVPSVLEVNSVFTAPGYEQFERLAMLRLARSIERRSFRLASLVVAVSTPLADQVRALADGQVIVVPNGADPALFDPSRADPNRIRMRYGLTGSVTVGWTGILRDWHGLGLLLDAIASLPSTKLLIVGDGPARGALEQDVVKRGLQHRVIITGRVSHDEVRDYIAAMDVAVVADERTGIASPMKLLEYMSMQRAVIAPTGANIEDVIDDGRDGVLFSPGDATALASQLGALIRDPARRHAVGIHARRKVETERNWLRIAAVVVDAVRRSAPAQPVRAPNAPQ